jgi:hypothetical protein
MRNSMTHYLIAKCHFNMKTLELLNYKNLKQLAKDYDYQF